MPYFNEDNVTEQMCIDVAKSVGYTYKSADELRLDKSTVIVDHLLLEALILESVRDALDVPLIVEPSLPAVESHGGEGCGVGSVHKPRGEGDYGIAFDIEIPDVEVKAHIHIVPVAQKCPIRRIGHIFLELLSSGSGAQENANR